MKNFVSKAEIIEGQHVLLACGLLMRTDNNDKSSFVFIVLIISMCKSDWDLITLFNAPQQILDIAYRVIF